VHTLDTDSTQRRGHYHFQNSQGYCRFVVVYRFVVDFVFVLLLSCCFFSFVVCFLICLVVVVFDQDHHYRSEDGEVIKRAGAHQRAREVKKEKRAS
jgi:uncharacterized membrane protein